MSIELVEKTLIKMFLDNFSPAWDDQLAYVNVPFTPLAGKPWMFYRFLHSEETPRTLGVTGNDQVDGMIQIDVNYPINAGEGTSRKTINELRACFHPQSISTYGQPVTIISRSKSGGNSVNNFYKIPFTVRWRSQIARNP